MKRVMPTGLGHMSVKKIKKKKMGFTDICPKPVGITLFMEILERVLRRKRPFPPGRASTIE
ncbi:MAG: hypothetical protein GY859_14720 [Desulfobacterales bacterium]|nr:hypothetical protein [Desulfobacterales bacterium]